MTSFILPIPDERIQGTSNEDSLIGTRGLDWIEGQQGQDYLAGRQGSDWLLGGAGHDILSGGKGGDQVNGGTGNDFIRRDAGPDTLSSGSAGNDILMGNRGQDLLQGGAGRDQLIGGQGQDFFELALEGGQDIIVDFEDGRDRLASPYGMSFEDFTLIRQGQHTVVKFEETSIAILLNVRPRQITDDDFSSFPPVFFSGRNLDAPTLNTIIVDEQPLIVETVLTGTEQGDRLVGDDNSNALEGLGGNDRLIGKNGVDVLSGGDGDDLLRGNRGNDRLNGQNDNDRLVGGAGRDNLQGGKGRDRLFGDQGNDLLRGDRGRDILVGGAGRDGFALQPGQGSDRILDFTDGDDRLGILDISLTPDDFRVRQVGNNTVIGINGQRVAVLVGISADLITANDFANVLIAW